MRHFKLVSKTPQVAISDLSGLLQSLLVVIELVGQLSGLANAVEAKKGAQG